MSTGGSSANGGVISPKNLNNATAAADRQTPTSSAITSKSTSGSANLGGYHVTVDNLATRTITTVMERSRTLILKLKNPDKSASYFWRNVKKQDDAIEPMIDALGKELVDLVNRAVHDIRNETKRARPQPGDDNYERKMEAYLVLVSHVTEMVNMLSNLFTEALTEYRRLINRLWDNLQSSRDEQETQYHIQQFLQQSDQIFRGAIKKHVEPLLKNIETKLN